MSDPTSDESDFDDGYDDIECFGTVADLLAGTNEGGGAARDNADFMNETRGLLQLAMEQLGDTENFLNLRSPESNRSPSTTMRSGTGTTGTGSPSPTRMRIRGAAALRQKVKGMIQAKQFSKELTADTISLSTHDAGRYMAYIDGHHSEADSMKSLLPPLAVFLADTPSASGEVHRASGGVVVLKVLAYYLLGGGAATNKISMNDRRTIVESCCATIAVLLQLLGPRSTFASYSGENAKLPSQPTAEEIANMGTLCDCVDKCEFVVPILRGCTASYGTVFLQPNNLGKLLAAATDPSAKESVPPGLLRVLSQCFSNSPDDISVKLPAAALIPLIHLCCHVMLKQSGARDASSTSDGSGTAPSPVKPSVFRNRSAPPAALQESVLKHSPALIDDTLAFLEQLTEDADFLSQGVDQLPESDDGKLVDIADVLLRCTQERPGHPVDICHAAAVTLQRFMGANRRLDATCIRSALSNASRIAEMVVNEATSTAALAIVQQVLKQSERLQDPQSVQGSQSGFENILDASETTVTRFLTAVRPSIGAAAKEAFHRAASEDSGRSASPLEKTATMATLKDISSPNANASFGISSSSTFMAHVTSQSGGGAEHLDQNSKAEFLVQLLSRFVIHTKSWEKGETATLLLALRRAVAAGKKSRAAADQVSSLVELWRRTLLLSGGSEPLLQPQRDADCSGDSILGTFLTTLPYCSYRTLDLVQVFLFPAREKRPLLTIKMPHVLVESGPHVSRLMSFLSEGDGDGTTKDSKKIIEAVSLIQMRAKTSILSIATAKEIVQLLEQFVASGEVVGASHCFVALKANLHDIDELTKPTVLQAAVSTTKFPFFYPAVGGAGLSAEEKVTVLETGHRFFTVLMFLCTNGKDASYFSSRSLHVKLIELRSPLEEIEALQIACAAGIIQHDETGRLNELLLSTDADLAVEGQIADRLAKRCAALLDLNMSRQKAAAVGSGKSAPLMQLQVQDQVQWLEQKLTKQHKDISRKASSLNHNSRVKDLEQQVQRLQQQLESTERQLVVEKEEKVQQVTTSHNTANAQLRHQVEEEHAGRRAAEQREAELKKKLEASEAAIRKAETENASLRQLVDSQEKRFDKLVKSLDKSQSSSNFRASPSTTAAPAAVEPAPADDPSSAQEDTVQLQQELRTKDREVHELKMAVELLREQYEALTKSNSNWPEFKVLQEAAQEVAFDVHEFQDEKSKLIREAERASEATRALVNRTRGLLSELQLGRTAVEENAMLRRELAANKKRYDFLHARFVEDTGTMGRTEEDDSKAARRLELAAKRIVDLQRDNKRLTEEKEKSDVAATEARRRLGVAELRAQTEPSAFPWAEARIARLELQLKKKGSSASDLKEQVSTLERRCTKEKRRAAELCEEIRQENEVRLANLRLTIDALRDAEKALQSELHRKDLIIAQLALRLEGRDSELKERARPHSAGTIRPSDRSHSATIAIGRAAMNRPKSASMTRSVGHGSAASEQRPSSAGVRPTKEQKAFIQEFVQPSPVPDRNGKGGMGYDARADPHLKSFFTFTKKVGTVKEMAKQIAQNAPKRRIVPGPRSSGKSGQATKLHFTPHPEDDRERVGTSSVHSAMVGTAPPTIAITRDEPKERNTTQPPSPVHTGDGEGEQRGATEVSVVEVDSYDQPSQSGIPVEDA